MSEPKIPDHTCPIIDQAVKYATEVQDGRIEIRSIDGHMGAIIEILEKLRAANEQLRDAVHHWRDEAKYYQDLHEKAEANA